MAAQLERIVFNLEAQAPAIRHETLKGRKHVVVPGVMITEGVHTGSDGPVFYSAEKTAQMSQAWNHKPLVVYHPTNSEGQNISSSDKVVIDTQEIGRVLNTQWLQADGSLPARQGFEAWIDEEHANTVDKRILENVMAGKKVEVSTGLFIETDGKPGVFNGVSYNKEAIVQKPDHLAILPDMEGACSIAKGAGLLANAAPVALDYDNMLDLVSNRNWSKAERDKLSKGDFGDPKRQAFPIKDQSDLDNAAHLIGHAKDPSAVKARLKAIAKRKGLKVPATWNQAGELTANEVSHHEMQSQAQDYVDSKHGYSGYVRDMYSDHFVFRKDGKHYTQKFAMNGNKLTVDEAAPPVEVFKTSRYETADGSFVVGNQKETVMDRKQLVDKLIGNGSGMWTEGDREFLTKLPDDRFKKFSDPVPAPAPAVNTAAPIIANGNPVPAVPPTPAPVVRPVSAEEYISNAPAGMQEFLREGLNAAATEKANLIKAITANVNNTFTAEELGVMKNDGLRRMAQLAGHTVAPVSNYAGMGGQLPLNAQPPVTNSGGVLVAPPTWTPPTK